MVFTSPINTASDPDSLLAAKLGTITVPVLIVGDTEDTCYVTLPSSNGAVRKYLKHSPRVSVEVVSGAGLIPLSDACNALSGHGFFGVEDTAVRKISSWISGGECE